MGLLDGKIALVTGASRGIGKSIADAFCAEGATVITCARNTDELEANAAVIRSGGGTVFPVKADICSEADVKNVFATIEKQHGRLDILVNNAGISKALATEDLPFEDFKRVLDTNVGGAFLCSKEAMRIMKAQKGGRIVNIGSIAALTPRQNSIAYTTSKTALEGLTRSLALDGRAHNISASILVLGGTATAFVNLRPDEAKNIAYHMDPADVARVVTLMVSLPPEVNMYSATLLPTNQPSFIGRG